MKLTYFFRKQSPNFHSIEELFFNIQKNLPQTIEYKNYFAKYVSKGFFRRFLICLQSIFNQADINHITGDIHFVSYFLKKKKTILTIHDIAPLKRGNFLKRKIIKFFWFTLAIKRVRYITVISEFTKNELLEHIKIERNKIIVIPNCVSSEIKFSEKEFNKTCPTILQIGTKENKNIVRLATALMNINCKLIIIGKLTESQKMILNKSKINFENYYNIDYLQIINFYQTCDIVAFVSTYEGFGVPILEANATGRVLITSNLSPMKEIANDSALLVNPYDSDEIRNGILELINNQELRNKLIANGCDNIKKYQSTEIAKQYANLYLSL